MLILRSMRGRSLKGWGLLVTAFLTCPCHLLLLAAVLAGTALGSFLSDHFTVILSLAALYFVGAISIGIKLLTPISQGVVATSVLSKDECPPRNPQIPRRS